jgi:hypothetical protein
MRAATTNTHKGVVASNYTDLKCSDTRTIILEHGSAGNDAACKHPVISEDHTLPWALHALAANGFGDAAIADTVPSTRPMSYEIYHAARIHRSFALRQIIIAAIHAAGALARRALACLEQRLEAGAYYDTLRQLDNRTPRDLGFDHKRNKVARGRSEGRSRSADVASSSELNPTAFLQQN